MTLKLTSRDCYVHWVMDIRTNPIITGITLPNICFRTSRAGFYPYLNLVVSVLPNPTSIFKYNNLYIYLLIFGYMPLAIEVSRLIGNIIHKNKNYIKS